MARPVAYPRTSGPRAGTEAGFSLIETLVVLAVISLLTGGVVLGVRSLVKSELRAQSGKLAAAIRYSYDRAISTGSYFRLHFDLDQQTYRLERSEARVLLEQREESGRNGRGRDKDKEDKQAEDSEKRDTGLPPELLPPPSPRRPKFSEYKDTTLPSVRMSRVHVLDILTPRQSEPYKAGHAYLHFFPDGHTERAVIHLGTDPSDDDQYTLFVHGLTGRVEVKSGRLPPPQDFDGRDTPTRGGS
ncbi:MAG: prepilin-type N-terminal cleavage/methylation domain-containing protein [Polyangia bacterium]